MNDGVNGVKALLVKLQRGAGVRAQLARGALQGLIVTALGVGVGFLMQVALARLLGVSEFGVYSWSLAWISALLLISCSGLEGLMSRRLPAYLIDRRFSLARGFLLFSGYWVAATALIVSLVLYAIAWIARDHLLPGALDTLAVCILVAPLFALGSLRQSILRALKWVSKGQLLEAVVRPLLLILFAVLLVFVFGAAPTSITAMIAQLIASLAVFVVGGLWVIRAMPVQARQSAPEWERKSWLMEAMPFFAISGASAVSRQLGTLVLGVFGTAAETGIYAVVIRIADFVLMGAFSVAAIASPLMVEVLKKNDARGLTHILKWGARGSTAFAAVAILAIVLLGEWILAAFGRDFSAGEGALHVMLYGALFGVLAGLSGILLAMSGQAAIRAKLGWIAAACNLLACVVLVPRLGLQGAAWSYTFAMLVDGILCLYFCWRHHKVWAGLS